MIIIVKSTPNNNFGQAGEVGCGHASGAGGAHEGRVGARSERLQKRNDCRVMHNNIPLRGQGARDFEGRGEVRDAGDNSQCTAC